MKKGILIYAFLMIVAAGMCSAKEWKSEGTLYNPYSQDRNTESEWKYSLTVVSDAAYEGSGNS